MGLAAARATLPAPVVFVPTMGALHDGHRALLHRGREICGPSGSLVVSIFVNPLQFGTGEDLDRYPRTLDRDRAVCAEEHVSVIFAPLREQMYPAEQMVTINPGSIGTLLEGTSRPGFFDGVLTVVLKLFNLVIPDVAIFGEKDAQQLALVRRMVADVNLPVEIVSVATVREPDGLALSSRNAYLSAAERRTALALSRALRVGRAAAADGSFAVLEAAGAELAAAAHADPPLVTDYLALADPVSFADVAADHTGKARLLVAGRVGSTRLIDNTMLTLGADTAAGCDAAGAHRGARSLP
jgi:pantoate--beta-alanine ligase